MTAEHPTWWKKLVVLQSAALVLTLAAFGLNLPQLGWVFWAGAGGVILAKHVRSSDLKSDKE